MCICFSVFGCVGICGKMIYVYVGCGVLVFFLIYVVYLVDVMNENENSLCCIR